MHYPTPTPTSAALRAALRILSNAALWLAGVTASPTDYRPTVGRLALRLRRATLLADAAHCAREAIAWRTLAREAGDAHWLYPVARANARTYAQQAQRLAGRARWARATA